MGKIEELITEMEQDKENSKGKLREIKYLLKSNRDDEAEWERLKLNFEKVHPEYFKRLQNDFPKLTQHELKHCAYLKIRLSNKEIATLLSVSPKSMQMARYRLKKKMNLGAEDDLLEFVANY